MVDQLKVGGFPHQLEVVRLEACAAEMLHQDHVRLERANASDEGSDVFPWIAASSHPPQKTENGQVVDQARGRKILERPAKPDLPEVSVFVGNI